MISPATSRTARRTELRAAALAGAAALILLVAGCGEDDSITAEAQPAQGGSTNGEVIDISGTEPVGENLAGSVAPLAQCRDWNGATDEQKLATIEDVRSQINLQDSGIDAPALTDDEALELFNGACEPAYAQGFRLYKLYSHAAGFVTLKRMIEAAEAEGE
jgi:hypothetical protein